MSRGTGGRGRTLLHEQGNGRERKCFMSRGTGGRGRTLLHEQGNGRERKDPAS